VVRDARAVIADRLAVVRDPRAVIADRHAVVRDPRAVIADRYAVIGDHERHGGRPWATTIPIGRDESAMRDCVSVTTRLSIGITRLSIGITRRLIGNT
jgi:hypothetical protein